MHSGIYIAGISRAQTRHCVEPAGFAVSKDCRYGRTAGQVFTTGASAAGHVHWRGSKACLNFTVVKCRGELAFVGLCRNLAAKPAFLKLCECDYDNSQAVLCDGYCIVFGFGLRPWLGR